MKIRDKKKTYAMFRWSGKHKNIVKFGTQIPFGSNG